MTPERWAEVKAVVAGAMESPSVDREQYLTCACGADDELRREVDSLLAASEGADSVPGVRAAVAAAQKSAMNDAGAALRAVIERALGTQYEIVRELGRGGMGAVFLARDRALERLVAVKVLRPELAEAPESRERFRREARIAAQLSHPGILPLHSYGEIDGLWYFVMGFARGQSLADRLHLEGALPAADVRRILIELADALEWAHRHGVIHRDIKPANILLDDESGRTILSDFGISKLKDTADGLTMTGAVWGSPHFMSPEQGIGSADVDERSDIYSFGAVGYTMLAGREPFAGVAASDLPVRRLTRDPEPIYKVAPTVPEDLAAVITRCLARDPAARWPSASELRDALGLTSGATTMLPEPVRDLPSFGPYAVLWVVAWGMLALLGVESTSGRLLLLLVAIIVPFGLLLHVWNIGRHGMGTLEIARIALWPPEWWGMWWPRSLRRPTDLWPRLPWPAKLVRVVLSAFLLAMPAVVLTHDWIARGEGGSSVAHRLFFGGEALLVLGTAAVVVGTLWWTHRRGLSLAGGARFLFGATVPSAAWTTADVARLLLPPEGGVRAPDRDSISDHRRSIADIVKLLPPEASSAGADAVRVAQRLATTIEQCDREVASLMRDASRGEIERLEAQLASLEPPAADGEGDERRQLRALIVHQLDLVRRMRGRADGLSHRRATLFNQLRGLWAQLCLVHNADLADRARAVDRLRGLCTEITDDHARL